MRKLLAIVTVAFVAGAPTLSIGPASADSGGVVAGCQTTLQWPGAGGASCGTGSMAVDGKAFGGFYPGRPLCTPTCTFGMSIDSYSVTCGGPYEITSAWGTLFISDGFSTRSATYSLVSQGAVVTIVFSGDITGTGVGAFIPDPRGLPTCSAPGTLTAHFAFELRAA